MRICRYRECAGIFYLSQDGKQVYRHSSRRSRSADVYGPSQQCHRTAQEQLHPWISVQNKSACEPGCAASHCPDREMPQASDPKIFPAHGTTTTGDVIDEWQLYQDARERSRIPPRRQDPNGNPIRKEQRVTAEMIELVRTQSLPRPWLANNHVDAVVSG